VATPAAQCQGRYRFEIAFEPRGAAPEPGDLLASARAFTVPPLVVAARKPGVKAPAVRSFLGIAGSTAGAVLSALKKAEDRDSVIVRLYNPGDHATDATLKPGFAVKQAFTVNFLEERHGPIAVENASVAVQLRPHQIQTIEIA
jgi:alpha-mannosidase